MSEQHIDYSFDPVILDEIVRALARIRHGALVITVHDARVVQIESRTKKRFTIQK